MNKLFGVSFVLCIIFYTCTHKPTIGYNQIEGFAQGTTYKIIYENNRGKDYSFSIDSILKCLDLSVSKYNSQSIISRINANDTTVRVDDHFRTVFMKAKKIWERSDGLMDITVGPVIDAIGFGADRKRIVDSLTIKLLLKYVGLEKVKLINDKIVKADTGIKLDVNTIAQGYSVDVISNFLNSEGIVNYLVEIGGEVRAKGRNSEGEYWRVGIDIPEDNNIIPGERLQTIIALNNLSVTTAGNYRKFYIEKGIKYSHIINPRTGFPVNSRLLSVTIVAKDCITADGWDTAFMVMGLEKSIMTLENQNELEALLIYSDENGNYREYCTDKFRTMKVQ